MEAGRQSITDLLLAWRQGDDRALQELTSPVYGHLHRLARHYIAGERNRQTLQATALVHEAHLRLVDCNRVDWRNRAQFFAVAAQVMRRVLVDFARARGNRKRGGGLRRTSFDDALVISDRPTPTLPHSTKP